MGGQGNIEEKRVGWAGGIISAEMAKAGKEVVALERGEHKERSDYIGVKDELRFDKRLQIMQNLSGETITSRNEVDETALPVRTRSNMQIGTGLGGASVHWAGATFFFQAEDGIRGRNVTGVQTCALPI